MATHTLMTAEQFDQLPEEEGRRYELLDGELIEMPSANLEHNLILKNGLFELEGFFRRTEIGTVVPEMEFAFGDDRFRPDLAVLLGDKLKQASLKRVPLTVVPDIVLEIVSPSESAINLDRKVRVYLQAGVAEVWVIYPDGQHMHAHSTGSVRLLSGADVLETGVLPGWSMPVSSLFRLPITRA